MDVKKDVELQKQKAYSQEVHKDFFTTRDKSKRGTSGLIEDSSEVLYAEAQVKKVLHEASLKERPLPKGTEPMFNTMFLTARRNKLTNESGLYLPTASFGVDGSTDLEQDFSTIQKVMEIGPHCQQVCKGMEVKINVENFKRRVEGGMNRQVDAKFTYEMPIVVIDDVEYIRISERDVDYIVDNKGLKKDE